MRKLAVALVVATFALSPLGAKVTTDVNPATSFSSYRTFSWAMKPETASPLMQQRIVDGINARLQAKGWTLVEKGDVSLAAHVTTGEKQSLDTFYTGTPMGGWGWRGWGGVGMGSATTTVRNYATGTLILDMFDTGTQQAIWRGTATGTVPSTPEKQTKALNKELDKMFAQFPPGSAAR
ncbi:MAG: DUF4136 domain-containing protein [Porphyrobacter sp.]|nr:DUF4136 domain-containing protein [Porphyrobacter sp.]